MVVSNELERIWLDKVFNVGLLSRPLAGWAEERYEELKSEQPVN
jgi:hypothetical protein